MSAPTTKPLRTLPLKLLARVGEMAAAGNRTDLAVAVCAALSRFDSEAMQVETALDVAIETLESALRELRRARAGTHDENLSATQGWRLAVVTTCVDAVSDSLLAIEVMDAIAERTDAALYQRRGRGRARS